MELGGKVAARIASMLEEVLDELFGPGFKAVLLFHLRPRIGAESLEDVVAMAARKPLKLYRALAETLGGETGADILVSTVSAVIIKRLGLSATPGDALEALKKGNAEAVARTLGMMDARSRARRRAGRA